MLAKVMPHLKVGAQKWTGLGGIWNVGNQAAEGWGEQQ